jgi:hypothetical protein
MDPRVRRPVDVAADYRRPSIDSCRQRPAVRLHRAAAVAAGLRPAPGVAGRVVPDRGSASRRCLRRDAARWQAGVERLVLPRACACLNRVMGCSICHHVDPGPMRHMNAIATPKSAPDAGLGAFTKEFRSRTGSRRVGERDRFSYPNCRLRRGKVWSPGEAGMRYSYAA